METVGEATWAHSMRSLKPGGSIVISGATSGNAPPADLTRLFFLQMNVLGSTMGTRDELEQLAQFLANTGVKPLIDSEFPLAEAKEGFARMHSGEVFGKVVFSR
jgi:NADPH:quinone reductase-like Zn-dependent oxidoreductase